MCKIIRYPEIEIEGGVISLESFVYTKDTKERAKVVGFASLGEPCELTLHFSDGEVVIYKASDICVNKSEDSL